MGNCYRAHGQSLLIYEGYAKDDNWLFYQSYNAFKFLVLSDRAEMLIYFHTILAAATLKRVHKNLTSEDGCPIG